MTFRGRCGCPIGVYPASPRCVLAGGPVTYCSALSSPRGDRIRQSAGDQQPMAWAAVIPGDLVRGADRGWWEVLVHEFRPEPQPSGPPRRTEVIAMRAAGVVLWAKTDATAQQHAAGWRALDPAAPVFVQARQGGLPQDTTAGPDPEQAARALVAYALGGVEIT